VPVIGVARAARTDEPDNVQGDWGNWWKSEEWRREEWDIAVQLVRGVGLYRIFRDLRKDAWYVEGLYD